MNTHTVIGIDPGYDRLGWAVGRADKSSSCTVIHMGCIETPKTLPLFERYAHIQAELNSILQNYQPTQASIESLFFFKNKKTALKVSEARGIIIAQLLNHHLSIYEYTPLQIKQSVTGFGTADKQAVEKMLRMQVSLPQENSSTLDDTIDACAILLTHVLSSPITHLTRQ